MNATQFPTDLTENYDMGLALVPGRLISSKLESKLFSVLGRVNYVLKDKYIFTTSFRRDGSSKFTPRNRYANFASGALAWRLSEEQFIKNLNVFDNLKLRLSYGQTGNQAIPDYQTMYTMRVANYPWVVLRVAALPVTMLTILDSNGRQPINIMLDLTLVSGITV